MADCLFCQIAAKKIKSEVVYEDEDLVVFKDIKPKAPIHLLIIPRKHIASLNDIEGEEQLIGKIAVTAKRMAERMGIAQAGYRFMTNCGKDGGQAVGHLHWHLMGGKPLDF